MSDSAMNTRHGEFYVGYAQGLHGAVVRLQEENTMLRRQAAELDELVSRFCKAAGEPIPTDALALIESWRWEVHGV